MNADILAAVVRAYEGSNGDVTTALYGRLSALGPAGEIGVNLFRAHKSSGRAKVYRRHRRAAYDRKGWAIDNLVRLLTAHCDALGLAWGWKADPGQEFHRWVLYVDLPTGQVSFHAGQRGDGPDYAGHWDGAVGFGADRICRWCARLLEEVHAA